VKVAVYLAIALVGHAFLVRECVVAKGEAARAAANFPAELTQWAPRRGNPVLTAGGAGHWDAKIRERGWIVREGDVYRMWFTGYDGSEHGMRRLGYACSTDGLHWKRWPTNPLARDHWVEDMMVVKRGGTYFMFAEGGDHNHAVMLTSPDGICWNWKGPLDVRLTDGNTRAKTPCGTPTIWIEDGKWYLFYERGDRGVWLAATRDVCTQVWVNVQDEPVLVPGPAAYDKELIALNQVIKHRGAYYAFYHGSGVGEPRTWNTNIARSSDLVNWQKYPGNPLFNQNKSSGIVVHDGRGYRLYTMHERVDVFCPAVR
jgi:hypothetical protein